MSNGDVPKPTTNGGGLGGMASVLTTLASSGDNWVKLLIVAGLFINTLWTKSNSTGIKDTAHDLDRFRAQAAMQLTAVYDNQRALADFMDETRMALGKLQDHDGIEHPSITPYPRQELQDFRKMFPQPYSVNPYDRNNPP